MKKLILTFFILLLGAYFGYYLVMEDYPVRDPGDTNLVLRVTAEDKAMECAISFLEAEKIRVELSERKKQHLAFVGLPEGVDTMRINYYAVGEGFRDIDIPLEYQTGQNFRLTIDPLSGETEYDIAYTDYLLGFLLGEGPVNLARYIYLSAAFYVTWVVFPVIWLVTLYTLAREYNKGLRRRFAGSWVYLGIGCVFFVWAWASTPLFYWVGILPEELRRIVYLLLAGYPLYFPAYLVLDENRVLGAEYRLLDEYFTYEEYQLSEGGTANGFVASWQDNYLIGIIGWLLGALLLPLSSYMRIILYYVTPFLHGSKTWRELSPIEAPGPGILSRLFGSRIKKRSIDQLMENDTDNTGDDDSTDVRQPVRRRRRKRRRPRRKAPYTDFAKNGALDGADPGQTNEQAARAADSHDS